MKLLEIDHNSGTVTIGTEWRNISLMEVKAKYNPKNIFNFPQNIPLF